MNIFEFYNINIGLEVHIELTTNTKAFCTCPNSFGDKPNTNICPICIAVPGTLPILNQKVVEYAVKTGLALNCNVNECSSFDRKHYFYPDLPKAYQITQIKFPICTEGFLPINFDEISKNIRIKQIHIEEDAGKLIHSKENQTFIDFNRSGVPLLELVTYPDFESSEEVIYFLKKLQKVLIYLQVSDAKMQEGSMRVDINLSVKKINQKDFGTRVEIKNINSFKSIKNAIEYEAKRQIKTLEQGKKIEQQTRRWNEDENITSFMRLKGDSSHYKYFNEPDLPIIKLNKQFIKSVKDNLGELPEQKAERFINLYKISEYDAKLITSSYKISNLFEEINNIYFSPKEVCNLLIGELFKILSENSLDYEEVCISPVKVASLVKLLVEKKINRTVYKQVFEQIFKNNVEPIKYVEEKNLILVEDENLVLDTVKNILDENKDAVFDFKNGKEKALAFLVGQTMKKLKGKASPEVVNKVLISELCK